MGIRIDFIWFLSFVLFTFLLSKNNEQELQDHHLDLKIDKILKILENKEDGSAL